MLPLKKTLATITAKAPIVKTRAKMIHADKSMERIRVGLGNS